MYALRAYMNRIHIYMCVCVCVDVSNHYEQFYEML